MLRIDTSLQMNCNPSFAFSLKSFMINVSECYVSGYNMQTICMTNIGIIQKI